MCGVCAPCLKQFCRSFFISSCLFSMAKQTCDSITTNCACEAALCVFKAPPGRLAVSSHCLAPHILQNRSSASSLICVSRCRPSSSNCIRCQRIAAAAAAAAGVATEATLLLAAARVEILKLTPRGATGAQVQLEHSGC